MAVREREREDVCVCVCGRVWACVRACVRACVCVGWFVLVRYHGDIGCETRTKGRGVGEGGDEDEDRRGILLERGRMATGWPGWTRMATGLDEWPGWTRGGGAREWPGRGTPGGSRRRRRRRTEDEADGGGGGRGLNKPQPGVLYWCALLRIARVCADCLGVTCVSA